MKHKKLLGLILVLGMLCAIGGTASAACRGWDGWQLSVSDRFIPPSGHPKATALLTRCHCLPVENFLSVSVQAQYEKNGLYTMVYSPSIYNTTYGSYIASVTATAYAPDDGLIVWAKGSYYAICGNNPGSSFTRTWTGDPGEAIGPVEE